MADAGAAVAFAQAQLGKPYVWASAGPKSFDCSGLTMRAWQAAGIKGVPHYTGAQWARFVAGRPSRSLDQAQPGDLVFYGVPPVPHHVALYIGNGKIIEAPHPGDVVKVSDARRYRDVINKVGAMPGTKAGLTSGGSGGGNFLLAYLRATFPSFSNEADAAIIGNFTVESSLDPNAYNAKENAHGYAQWEGGRWSGPHGLQAYARSHGLSPLSPAAEAGYLGYELNHGYQSVRDALATPGKGVDTYAQIFQSKFEGSTPDSLGARQSAARDVLGKIKSGQSLGGDATLTASTTSIPAPPYRPLAALGPLFTPPLAADVKTAMLAWLAKDGQTIAATSSDVTIIAKYEAAAADYYRQNPIHVGASANPADIVSNALSTIETWGKRLAAWAGDAVLIVGGIIFVLLALVIMARSGGMDVTGPASSSSTEEHTDKTETEEAAADG